MMQRLKNVVSNIEGLDLETLKAIKYALFVFIVVDMMGIYWYFRMKKLGIALMVVLLLVTAMIFYLEQRKRRDEEGEPDFAEEKEVKKMSKKKKKSSDSEKRIKELEDKIKRLEEKKDKKTKKEPEREENAFGFDFGSFNADDYRRNMEDAFGTL